MRSAELPRIPRCAHFQMGNQTTLYAQHKWFLPRFLKSIAKETSTERGQPSHAAFEGEGRIVLHHEPNQEQLDDSTEGLRRSGRRRWLVIYKQD